LFAVLADETRIRLLLQLAGRAVLDLDPRRRLRQRIVGTR
jgi:hypothetical protein